LFLNLEGLRIIILAIKRKKEGAYIIGAGVIVFVIFILTIFGVAILGTNLSGIYSIILVFLGLFAVPISMSIYLAHNIASTNKNLARQLDNVKQLSQKELENQKKTAELELESEKEKAASHEAELRAQAAELQAKAAEAQSRAIQAENDRKTKELEEARDLQLSMLPKDLPKLNNVEIATYMQTATEVGGDYYDFHVGEDGILTTAVGDATGHGLNAGTIVTITKSLFNTYAASSDIIFTFQEISKSIKKMKFKLLSMCLMIMKIEGNILKLSAAGMPPTLIYRNKEQKLEEFLIRGMPLGAPASFPYEIKSTTINSGDTILIMSDGYPELFNSKKEMLGYKKARENFLEVAEKEPNEIIEHLKSTSDLWMGENDPDDDITFVVLKIR